MLFVSGLLELHAIRKFDRRQQNKEANLTLAAVLKDPKATREEKNAAFVDSGMAPTIACSLFEVFTMLCAIFFAFKATFFFILPIWLTCLASGYSPFNWKEHRVPFILDNCFCATLFFVAAWVVA
jgi:hypothetical protein